MHEIPQSAVDIEPLDLGELDAWMDEQDLPPGALTSVEVPATSCTPSLLASFDKAATDL